MANFCVCRSEKLARVMSVWASFHVCRAKFWLPRCTPKTLYTLVSTAKVRRLTTKRIQIVLLAALSRLRDIARRVSEGLDLRPIEDMLHSNDEAQHEEAVERLEDFALKGRPGAPRLLEKILLPEKAEDPHFGPEVRFAAAAALAHYAERRGRTGALYLTAEAYRKILREDWTKQKDAEKWADTQNNLGCVLEILGDRESGTARLDEAVAAYRAALELRTRADMPTDWAMSTTSAMCSRASATARAGRRSSKRPSPPIAPRWRSEPGPTCRPTGP
jgi:hypothetical protein